MNRFRDETATMCKQKGWDKAHVRGFLERKRQNKARFVPIIGPNGKVSIAVRKNVPTSGFRAIAAKRAAENRNLKRMLQGFTN